MLRELHIRDLAIIDEMSLAFAPGFNVLTGETGAGKSIIMQAIDLLCGGRASADAIRSGADEAAIEGLFDLEPEARRALEAAGLPADEELVIRRLISRTGRNRIYVNGALASVGLLEPIGEGLIHVYGQHEHASLLRADSYLDLLDAFAGHPALRAEMEQRCAALEDTRGRLDAARARQASAGERLELLRFQVQELDAAALLPGEEEAVRREREVLANAERLAGVCGQGEDALYSGDDAVAGRLARLGTRLTEAARIDDSLSELVALLDSARSQVEEVAYRLRAYGGHLSFDPGRREAAEERLALIARLKRKYGSTVEEILDARTALATELTQAEAAVSDVAHLEAEWRQRADNGWQTAAALSTQRREAARRLERQTTRELRALGMPGATFAVHLATATPPSRDAGSPSSTGLHRRGADAADLVFSGNPGEPAKSLAKVASGGELSRIMLALKVLTAAAGEVPALIFDEVDAGIGGEVADAVGERLHTLSRDRQILCITHLPQIAGRADHHFVVAKGSRRGRTVSHARPLSDDERVRELARMLGAADEAEAMRFARRLLSGVRRDVAAPSRAAPR